MVSLVLSNLENTPNMADIHVDHVLKELTLAEKVSLTAGMFGRHVGHLISC